MGTGGAGRRGPLRGPGYWGRRGPSCANLLQMGPRRPRRRTGRAERAAGPGRRGRAPVTLSFRAQRGISSLTLVRSSKAKTSLPAGGPAAALGTPMGGSPSGGPGAGRRPQRCHSERSEESRLCLPYREAFRIRQSKTRSLAPRTPLGTTRRGARRPAGLAQAGDPSVVIPSEARNLVFAFRTGRPSAFDSQRRGPSLRGLRSGRQGAGLAASGGPGAGRRP